MSADVELWGHVDLPAMLLDNEAELRATLRDFYGDDAGDEFDRVALTRLTAWLSMTTCSTSATGGWS